MPQRRPAAPQRRDRDGGFQRLSGAPRYSGADSRTSNARAHVQVHPVRRIVLVAVGGAQHGVHVSGLRAEMLAVHFIFGQHRARRAGRARQSAAVSSLLWQQGWIVQLLPRSRRPAGLNIPLPISLLFRSSRATFTHVSGTPSFKTWPRSSAASSRRGRARGCRAARATWRGTALAQFKQVILTKNRRSRAWRARVLERGHLVRPLLELVAVPQLAGQASPRYPWRAADR